MTQGGLEIIASNVQLISMPLEVVGLLLVCYELYFKEKVDAIELWLTVILAASKRIYTLKYNLEINSDDFNKQVEKYSEYIIGASFVLFNCFFIVVSVFVSYFLTKDVTEHLIVNLALAFALIIIALYFYISIYRFSSTSYHYGGGDLAIIFGMIVIFPFLFLIYPFYLCVKVLKKCGKGKAIGGLGLVLALLGVTGEVYQVIVLCNGVGPCYTW